MFPRKLPFLIFVPLPYDKHQPSHSLSYILLGILFTLTNVQGYSSAPLHPKSNTSDHPHPVQIHHAVVCRPYILPHTTHVDRHATSAHAHLIVGTVTVVTALVTTKNTSSHARARAVSSISVHATANVAGSRDT